MELHRFNTESAYGVKCKTNDIIEMICDLDELELIFIINNMNHCKAFDIEKAKYVAVLNLYDEQDSITILE